MIKDTFFSLPRFMNLCRKEMVENWKSNVLRMVLMYGVMAVVMVWNGYFRYRGTYNYQEELLKDCPIYQEIYYSQFPKEAVING